MNCVVANGAGGRAAIAAAIAMRFFGQSHQILVDGSGVAATILL
jgi:hypothetical protein